MGIPDNYDILRLHEERRARQMLKYPKCCSCEERIQDAELYDIDGNLYCESCLNYEFKKHTDNYILEAEE